MRAYTFINSYIRGIQVGIQAGHANVQLISEYPSTDSSVIALTLSQEEDPEVQIVQEWANKHKTFVWLDGGDVSEMDDIAASLLDSDIPWTSFSEPGLGNVTTAISLVLTTEQVELTKLIRENNLSMEEEDDYVVFMDSFGDIAFSIDSSNEAEILFKVATSRTKTL